MEFIPMPGRTGPPALQVPSERERIAKLIEEFDDFVFAGRKVDGYSKGTYAMVDERASMKVLADQVRGMA